MHASNRATCEEDGCKDVCLNWFRERGMDVTVTTAPPLIETGYEALDMYCPHGVLWYAEPTSEQRRDWFRAGTP